MATPGRALRAAAPRDGGGRSYSSGSVPLTYAAAGVSIDAGNALVERIKPLAKATTIPGCEGESLGGFGSVFDLEKAGFGGPDVLLVSGTDGVGTKLRLAQRASLIGDTRTKAEIARGLGIDLVAMCRTTLRRWVPSRSSSSTTTRPGVWTSTPARRWWKASPTAALRVDARCLVAKRPRCRGSRAGDFGDVAGFCVGAVRKRDLLPRTSSMQAGDVLIGVSEFWCPRERVFFGKEGPREVC